MIKKYFRRLESIIALAQSLMTPKQFLFLSSVLTGISCAFAVIILKTFAHSVFSFATYINGILKLSFINSILPIIGIVLTVFVVKKSLTEAFKKELLRYFMQLQKKQVLFRKSKCMHRLLRVR